MFFFSSISYFYPSGTQQIVWLVVAHTVAVGMPVAVFAHYPPTIHFVLVVRNMAALRAAVQTWWCVLINDFLVNCMLYVVAAPLWDF